MKPLSLRETKLKEEMKSRCFNNGQYMDKNAKAKFNMLCHLEDFEVQYWNLEEENKKYKEVFDKLAKAIDECWYMDSENVGEQVFLKKSELKDILKEVE